MNQTKRSLLKVLGVTSIAVMVWEKPAIKAVALPAHAALTPGNCVFRFTSTVDEGSGVLPNGVSSGDSFVIEVGLDNGNGSLLNQTWSFSDLLYVNFIVSNGAFTAFFDVVNHGIPSTTVGSFQTDGTGSLTAAPDDWDADSDGTETDSQGGVLEDWFINNNNDIVFTSIAQIGAVHGTNDLGRWAVC